MPVFDQFDVEPRSVYSGSTSSRVFWGDIYKNRATHSPESSASIYRYTLGDKISGLETNYRQSLWVYSDMLYYFSGSYMRGDVRHLSLFSNNETYFDSYTANPLEIYMKSLSIIGITGAWIDKNTMPGNLELDIKGVPAGTGVRIYLGSPNPKQVPAEFDKPVSPFSMQYPFQSLFKNFTRLFKSTYDTSYIVKSNYDSDGTFGHYTASNIGLLEYISKPVNTTQYQRVLVDLTMSCTSSIQKSESIIDYPNDIKNTNKIRPSYNVFLKSFFGTGDGLSEQIKLPSRKDTLLINSPTYIDYSASADGDSWVFAPELRGFKYGLYHCNPQFPKHIYRLKSYGQFRDRLEQPQYSKIRTKTGNDISYFVPVSIVFNGSPIEDLSADYKNAVTATWYNPMDSGIYDYEYRAGQPYADDKRIPPMKTGES